MTDAAARPQNTSPSPANNGVATTNDRKTPPEKVTCWQQVAGGVLDLPMRPYATTAVRPFGSRIAFQISSHGLRGVRHE